MESSQSFDCQDFALFKERRSFIDSAFQFFSGTGLDKFDLGTADGTRDGLSMISSVKRISVFFFARGAHDEAFHGGLFPVIRKGLDNSVARATVCAVDEWVAVSPVSRQHHLRRAIFAHRNVGRDKNETLFLFGFFYYETFESKMGRRANRDFFYLGERRGIVLKLEEKVLEVALFVFFDVDFHSESDVFYPTFVVEVLSQAIDKRTEAHSLDNAKHHHFNRQSFSFLHFLNLGTPYLIIYIPKLLKN